MKQVKYILNTLSALVIFAGALQAQNWPQWRGPGANGIAEPGNYPVKFSSTEGLIWKTGLPGKGGSTPVVWKDRIIITSGIGEGSEAEDGVLCFDWSGKLLWQVKLGKQKPRQACKGQRQQSFRSN